jgi:aldehyde dehydrogenase (NAD+)
MTINGSSNGTHSASAFFSKSNLPRQLFINNEYVESKGSAKVTVYNPIDESEIANDIPIAGEADVEAAVAAAEKAFPEWKNVPALKRREIMLKFADLIEAQSVPLAELTRISLGAPYEAFGKFEVGLAAEVCI